MATIFLNDIQMQTVGKMPEQGTQAPDFSLTAQNLTEINPDSFKGKRIILNIFPSLDTEVCATSVRKFNKTAAEHPDTVILCVSMDLPFAAARFCSTNGIENVQTASAFRSDFGKKYGIEIADGPMRGLLARAIVVIDKEGKIAGTSICEQITHEPDYEFALNLLK